MNVTARHRTHMALAGLLLLAFALRLFRLDYQSIWWDEGISLHLATSGIAEIFRDRLDNIHPPLYFVLLKGWLALVGVSPFTGRYLSALASLTQVALVFTAARHWGGQQLYRRSALPWIAAGLVLLSPLSVIYGQEIRVYAMLPLAYIAALLLTERLLAGAELKTRPLIYLALAEWLGLHLHYIAIFGVAYVSLWGLIVLIRRRDGVGLRRWVIAHIAVVVASLPWLLAVLGNWAAVRAEAGAGTFMTDPVPLPFLFSQVWAFHLTGLAGSLADPFVRAAAGLSALLVAGLIAYYAISVAKGQSPDPRSEGGRTSLPLSISSSILRVTRHWLLPLVSGLIVWSVRSFSHPRYIIMFAALLIPLVALLIYSARRRPARAAALVLAVCVISLSFWGLRQYFFDPDTAKPDIRAVASYLEATAQSGDLILIPDTDWSLVFEYNGEAAVLMPNLAESPHDPDSALVGALDCSGGRPCAESGRVFVIDYPRGTRDWQARLPFELELRGHWVSETPFNDVTVREYRLREQSGPLPGCDSPDIARPAVRFGSLSLDAAWIEQGAASDMAVAVALCWRALEPAAGSAVASPIASLVLRDPVTGERVAQTDTALLNKAGATAEQWPPGESVVTYHLLPFPPGTPPVDLDLSLGVYTIDETGTNAVEGFNDQGNPAGQLISLGHVAPGSPIGQDTPYETDRPPLGGEPTEAFDGLQLLGARFNSGPYRPGQKIRVRLTWRSTAERLPDLRPALVLEQDGEPLVENADAPANGRYPTDRWRLGEMVFEHRDIRIPAGIEGPVQLVMTADGRRIELGEVSISGSTVLVDQPPVHTPVDMRFEEDIALIGFDPPDDVVSPGSNLPLTLYWKSPSGDISTSYTVFVHLIDESGTPIAQHDSPPANGQRPTDEWLPGEFIIDAHELSWRDPDFTGAARLAVGLYDPATGRRLTTTDGSDSFILPMTIDVQPAP